VIAPPAFNANGDDDDTSDHDCLESGENKWLQ